MASEAVDVPSVIRCWSKALAEEQLSCSNQGQMIRHGGIRGEVDGTIVFHVPSSNAFPSSRIYSISR
jgi:hypothetical protein